MGWFYKEVRWGYFVVRGAVEPLSEIKLVKDGVEITVDLPGVSKESLSLSASEDAIMIEATSTVGGTPVRYRKLLKMPIPIDPDGVRAKLSEGGILYIFAPAKAKGFRKVEVE